MLLSMGALAGTMAGLLGIGGGIIIVPVFAWIFMPSQVKFFISKDGKKFIRVAHIKNDVSPEKDGALIKNFQSDQPGTWARFIKITASNIGVCPPWHKGAGNKAWIFADEIVIN